MNPPDLARYARQIIFPDLGAAGQRRLLDSTVVLVGCGATGTMIANHLARSGVGHLRIVDRDFIELNNLQRQALFDEQDLAEGLPKAEAARRKLSKINSQIVVEGIVADVTPDNVMALLVGADLVMDGADNFETRFLLNDACVKLGLPWVYSGVIASYGMTMTIRPGETACLRCLLGQMPAPGTAPTCDTAGALAPSVSVVASIAAGEALKLLAGFGELNAGVLLNFDLLDNSLERFEVLRRPDCPTCSQRNLEFLHAESGVAARDLLGLDDAIRGIHQPPDHERKRAARRRLVFDELYVLQLGLQWRRARLEADTAAPAKDLRILLAEDNIVNQKVALGLLKPGGHSVDVANDGRAALALATTALTHVLTTIVII